VVVGGKQIFLEPADPTCLDYVQTVATVLAAAGTIAAVLVALYLNVWQERQRAPALSLALPPDWPRGWDFSTTQRRAVRPLVLEIENAKGRRTARNVEVLLTTDHGGEAGTHEVHQGQLVWDIPGNPAQVDIPPGVARSITVAFVGGIAGILDHIEGVGTRESEADEEKKKHLEGQPGMFAVLPTARDGAKYVFADDTEHEITLLLTATDADAIEYQGRLIANFTEDEDEDYPDRFSIRVEWLEAPRLIN
jgi:hypothetical protein